MLEFTSTFGLGFNQLIAIRVSASNMMGLGQWSMTNSQGAATRAVPAKMIPIVKGSLSSAISLELTWQAMTTLEETGNSEVMCYEIYWDANSGLTNIQLYAGPRDAFSYTVESLVAGLEYRFMIRAINIYGNGEWSDEAILIPDAVPAMMSSISTSLDYPLVTFYWEEPFNNGRVVTAYQLEIYSITETRYVLDTNVCDASSAFAMMDLSCSVSMSTLLEQYGYIRGQMIIAKVRAFNLVGWGHFSSQNSAGVVAQTEPTLMSKPMIDEA